MQGQSILRSLDLKNKTVIVTGASAGIGRAAAVGFAEKGCKLVILARRQERLLELQQYIQELHKVPVHIVSLDIQNIEQLKQLPNTLPIEFSSVDILVNNAGLGLGMGPIDTLNLEEAFITLDTNVKSLLALIRVFTPGMKQRGYGHVINISSRAAEYFAPNAASYFASKHACKAISECARQDLVGTPLRVTEIRPGLVQTEFVNIATKGNKEKEKAVYGTFQPLDPNDVADNIIYAATRPLHVQINSLTVQPTNQGAGSAMK